MKLHQTVGSLQRQCFNGLDAVIPRLGANITFYGCSVMPQVITGIGFLAAAIGLGYGQSAVIMT